MFVQKFFWPIKFLVTKKFWSKHFLVQLKFWSKINYGPKKLGQKKFLVQNIFGPRKNFGPKNIWFKIIVFPIGDLLQLQHSCQKLGFEGLLWLSKKCPRPQVSIKVAKRRIVQRKGNGHHLKHQRSSPKFWVEKLSKQCPMTYLTMFQASSVYKSFKLKHSSAYGI